MDELFHDKTLFGGENNDNAKPVEVIPEMLDFDFVNDRCDSINELKAILHSLQTGEHGKYPQLEQCVRAKLDKLTGKSHDTAPTPSIECSDTSKPNERESLLDWLGGITNHQTHDTTSEKPVNTIPPVRATTHTDLSNAVVTQKPTTIEKDMEANDTHANNTPTAEKKTSPSNSTKKTDTAIFRKEKLSTKVGHSLCFDHFPLPCISSHAL